MKAIVFALILVGTIVAIATGWIYENRATENRPELEIPSDIDYFLAEFKYRSMNDAGHLDFTMQSPYLEHLTVSNISLIEKPSLQIYRNSNDWTVESLKGKLFHEQNSLQLIENVTMQRDGADPMLIRAEEMLFQPDLDLVSSEKTIDIESSQAVIRGSNAVFDLKNKVYSLKNTRATYYLESS